MSFWPAATCGFITGSSNDVWGCFIFFGGVKRGDGREREAPMFHNRHQEAVGGSFLGFVGVCTIKIS